MKITIGILSEMAVYYHGICFLTPWSDAPNGGITFTIVMMIITCLWYRPLNSAPQRYVHVFIRKYLTGLKRFTRDKQTTSFSSSITDEEKKFHNIDTLPVKAASNNLERVKQVLD